MGPYIRAKVEIQYVNINNFANYVLTFFGRLQRNPLQSSEFLNF